MSHPCPRCRAEAGQPCQDYRGKGKPTCSERGKLPAPEAPVQRDLFGGREGGQAL